MNNNQKLYIIVRRDLSPGYQAVQGTHAFMEFVNKYPFLSQYWYKKSNYLCFLSVKDEFELVSLINEANQLGLKWAAFQEPDVDNQTTAVAFEPSPEAAELCSSLPLALREFGRPPSHVEKGRKTNP